MRLTLPRACANRSPVLLSACLLAALFAFYSPAHAQSGSNTGTWNNSGLYADWDYLPFWNFSAPSATAPNNLPGATYNAVIPYGYLYTTRNITLQDLTFRAALWGSGDMTINHHMLWDLGTMAGQNQLVIAPAATLDIQGSNWIYLSRVLNNYGQINWTGNNTIQLYQQPYAGYSNPFLNNYGTFYASGTSQNLTSYSSGLGYFYNYGTIIKNGGGTSVFLNDLPFINSATGVVRVDSGILSLASPTIGSGTFNIAAGGELQFFNINNVLDNATIKGDGLANINARVTFRNTVSAQNLTMNGDAYFDNGLLKSYSPSAVLNINAGVGGFVGAGITGTGSILSNGTININDGSLGGAVSATLAPSGTLNFNGGYMVGTGITTINSGATLNLAGGNASLGRTLTNFGTTYWTGANSGLLFRDSNGVFDNRGTFLALNNNSMARVGSSTGLFLNSGSFTKQTGTGTSVIDVPFFNSNVVHLKSGLLKTSSGYTQQAGGFTYLEGGNLSAYNSNNIAAIVTNEDGGSIFGAGTIYGPVVNAGVISPGSHHITAPGPTPDTINIVGGDFKLEPTSLLKFHLAGRDQGVNFDFFRVTHDNAIGGNVVLGGQLYVELTAPFSPLLDVHDRFYIVRATGDVTGSFTNVSNGQRITTVDGHGSFIVEWGQDHNVLPGYVLLYNYIPEPSTAGLALVSATFAMLRRRRPSSI